jgi:ABC-type amino acid transport substrate-binding protein/AmiR/NasT family two-component response regulator
MNDKHHTKTQTSRFRIRFISITLIALTFITLSAGADERIIRIGGDRAYPPFEFLDETGQPAGFNIDLARAVAATMGYTVRIELSSWSEARARLDHGIVDMLAGMYSSPSRQTSIDFSQPYYNTDYSLFARKGSAIKGLKDIRSLRIAVQDGDLGHEFLVAEGLGPNLLLLENGQELFQALINGNADCALFSATAGWLVLDDTAYSSLEAVPTPLFRAGYCMAVRKGNTSLLSSINEGLSILKANGEYETLYRRWFSTSEKPQHNAATGMVAALVVVALTLSAVVLTRLKTTQRPPRRSADELSAAAKRRAELDAQLQDALSLPAEPLAAEPVMQPLKARVIVAEDEAINRMYLKRILEKAGYEVRAAADGQAALEAAAERIWDFILMDVSMPRMDGLEATRRIRALEMERKSPRIPIIALTAHAYAEDREACAQAGMDGFLPKPFTEPALWAEVSRIAESRVAESRLATDPPGR